MSSLRLVRREHASNFTNAQADFDELDLTLSLRVVPRDANATIFEEKIALSDGFDLEPFKVGDTRDYVFIPTEDFRSEHRDGCLSSLYNISCGPNRTRRRA